MMVFMGMIILFWFGIVPDHLLDGEMPPMIAELFLLIKIGLGGYIVGRSVEKVAESAVLPKILNQQVNKTANRNKQHS